MAERSTPEAVAARRWNAGLMSTLSHSCDSRARNCWTRLKTHGPFEEYDPPQPGVSYLIPHYRCSTCGHKVSLIAGVFLRPVDGGSCR